MKLRYVAIATALVLIITILLIVYPISIPGIVGVYTYTFTSVTTETATIERTYSYIVSSITTTPYTQKTYVNTTRIQFKVLRGSIVFPSKSEMRYSILVFSGSYILLHLEIPNACRFWVYVLPPAVPPQYFVKEEHYYVIRRESVCAVLQVLVMVLRGRACSNTTIDRVEGNITIPWSFLPKNITCFNLLINNDVVYRYKSIIAIPGKAKANPSQPVFLDKNVLSVRVEYAYYYNNKLLLRLRLGFGGPIGVHVAPLDVIPSNAIAPFGLPPKTIAYILPNNTVVVEYYFLALRGYIMTLALITGYRDEEIELPIENPKNVVVKIYVNGILVEKVYAKPPTSIKLEPPVTPRTPKT